MIGALIGYPSGYEGGVSCIATRSGVGYEVNLPFQPISEDELCLYVHSHYPDKGAPSLWGFREKDERDCFRRLLKIDGVGPKVAMRIVGNKAVSMNRFDNQDYIVVPATLLAVRGVGATLAKRIQEELSK